MVNVGGPGAPAKPRSPARDRDPIEIVANTLSDPADMKALIRAIELLSGDREFRQHESVRKTRGHAGESEGSRA